MYTDNKQFEWDSEKARLNAVKHGIGFQTAACAFDDPFAFVLEDEKHSAVERRQWLIGDSGPDILVVVFTIRASGRIRIISARRAGRRETRIYEERKRIRFFEGPPGHA